MDQFVLLFDAIAAYIIYKHQNVVIERDTDCSKMRWLMVRDKICLIYKRDQLTLCGWYI